MNGRVKNDMIDEVGRYKKRAKHDPIPKANHKHEYHDFVFEYNSIRYDKIRGYTPKPDSCIGSYCIICGKVGGRLGSPSRWSYPAQVPGKTYWETVFTDEYKREMKPKTRTIPTFFLEDRFDQKFVELEDETHGS